MEENQEEKKKGKKKSTEVATLPQATAPDIPVDNNKLSMIGSAVAVLSNLHVFDKIKEYMYRPYEKETPAEKVKKLPGSGYDYVKYGYMDREFKDLFPLYSWEVLHKDIVMGWILYTVKVTDRTTGNSQLGSGGARIATFKNAEVLDHKAIVDMGHNDASALSNALKNAMSRFGICADVYRRVEEDLTDEQKDRWNELYKQMPIQWKIQVEEKWRALGGGYSDFLDTLELRIADYNKKEQDKLNRVGGSANVQQAQVIQDVKQSKKGNIAL